MKPLFLLSPQRFRVDPRPPTITRAEVGLDGADELRLFLTLNQPCTSDGSGVSVSVNGGEPQAAVPVSGSGITWVYEVTDIEYGDEVTVSVLADKFTSQLNSVENDATIREVLNHIHTTGDANFTYVVSQYDSGTRLVTVSDTSPAEFNQYDLDFGDEGEPEVGFKHGSVSRSLTPGTYTFTQTLWNNARTIVAGVKERVVVVGDGASNDLADTISTQTLDLITSYDPGTKLSMFSSSAKGAYTRNPAFWLAELDTTGVCIQLENVAPPELLGNWGAGMGALITPKHMICARHNSFAAVTDWKFGFVDSLGAFHERTVVARVADPTFSSSLDFAILTLSSDLPATVSPMRVFGPDWNEFVDPAEHLSTNPANWWRTQGVVFRQNNAAYLVDMSYQPGTSFLSGLCRASLNPTYPLWTRTGVTGDSGHPWFVVLNGELVLMASFFGGTSGYSYARYVTEINAVLAGDGDYSLELIDPRD